MAPLVLIGTVVTHLFGGSAGREGTAVQMGGTLANLISKPLRLSPEDHRLLLMAGISGGFGSVFGTPLAGTVFGLEVISSGPHRLCRINSLLCCRNRWGYSLPRLGYPALCVSHPPPACPDSRVVGMDRAVRPAVRRGQYFVRGTDPCYKPYCQVENRPTLAASFCRRLVL